MRSGIAVLLGAACLCAAGAAGAQGFQVERIASGLARPVFLTAPPGDSGRVFILEQHTGNIRILDLATRQLLQDPFLTVPGISTGNEQGLLGLAFHPDYASNGWFFVYVTVGSPGASEIYRYTVSGDPDLADASTSMLVLSFSQPDTNPNAG